MCKIEKSGRGRLGRGGGFGNSDTPGQGEGGWFENPRFWRTSFVDGPLSEEIKSKLKEVLIGSRKR